MNKLMKQFIDNKKENPQYYAEISIKNIKSPITVLLGPNGTGKSMSLRNINCQLQLKKINFIKYTTSKDDIVQKGAPAFGNWDVSKIACAFTSEGERMTSSFFDWANTTMLSQIMTNDKELWMLIDEMDSGLSFDRLMESLLQIVSILKMEVSRGRKIYAIFTCNSYEMAELLQSPITDYIWVPTKEHIKLGSYYKFKKKYIDYYDKVHKERNNE